MKNFTFLEAKQVLGYDINLYGLRDRGNVEQLDIFRKYGPFAEPTDFATLLGVQTEDAFLLQEDDYEDYDINRIMRINQKNKSIDSIWEKDEDGNGHDYLNDEIDTIDSVIYNYEHQKENNYHYISADTFGSWWSKTNCEDGAIGFSVLDGNGIKIDTDDKRIGARPAINFSEIEPYVTKKRVNNIGILEVEYGEYPQFIEDIDISKKLENLYIQQKLSETGKEYTTNAYALNDYSIAFIEEKHKEYQYNGKKYIRFMSKDEVVHWIKVSPIVWLVDQKSNIAVSEQILFAGIVFNYRRFGPNYRGCFETTDIKAYMDKYFSKEIIPSNTLNQEQEIKMSKPKTRVRKK